MRELIFLALVLTFAFVFYKNFQKMAEKCAFGLILVWTLVFAFFNKCNAQILDE